jgi:hypothetical protein
MTAAIALNDCTTRTLPLSPSLSRLTLEEFIASFTKYVAAGFSPRSGKLKCRN